MEWKKIFDNKRESKITMNLRSHLKIMFINNKINYENIFYNTTIDYENNKITLSFKQGKE